MTGFTSPNHTQCPNDLFDVHMLDMGECELKVTLAIIRKTLGYHKKSDPISLTQLQKATGLSRQGVSDGATAAIDRGLVEVIGTGKRGVLIYGLVINSDQSEKKTDESADQSKNQTRTSQKSRHTKERPTKEKTSKEKGLATQPKPPKKLVYPPSPKEWTWKHIEQYATENPNVQGLVCFDTLKVNLSELTTWAARDLVELHKELTRLKVSPERWSNLRDVAEKTKAKYNATIYRRMFWVLEGWLKSDPPLTVVTPPISAPPPSNGEYVRPLSPAQLREKEAREKLESERAS